MEVGVACVVYAAKSTEDRHGSIDGQLQESKELIAADPARRLVAEYTDEAVSGYTRDRGPGLAAALAHTEHLAAEYGTAELWAQHSDRLARGDGRTARHTVEIALWALKHDVKVRTVQDPDTFRDLLYAVVTGQRNHEDSRRKSLATRAGLRRSAELRGPLGPAPDGYLLHRELDQRGVIHRTLHLDPDRQPAVALIFRLACRGRSPTQIARVLNDRGIKTRPVRSCDRPGRFDHTVVFNVLMNRRYSGQATFKGAVIGPGDWPRYLTPTRHARLIERVARSRARVVAERRRATVHLLAGLAVCGECGAPLRLRLGRDRPGRERTRRYVCAGRLIPASERCQAAPLDTTAVEQLVLTHLPELLTGAAPAGPEPAAGGVGVGVLRARLRAAALTGDDERLDQAVRALTHSRQPAHRDEEADRDPGLAARELLEHPPDPAAVDADRIGEANVLLCRALTGIEVRVEPETITLTAHHHDGTHASVGVDRAAWVKGTPVGGRRTVSALGWSPAECIGALQGWARRCGRSPTCAEWKRGRGEHPCANTVLKAYGQDWNQALRAAGLASVRARRHLWDEPMIIAALRAWSVEHGRSPHGLDWLTATPARPAGATVRARFGSWAHALHEAGLPPATRRRNGSGRAWSDQQILTALHTWSGEHGRAPRTGDWRNGTSEHPSSTTVFRHFPAGWAATLNVAGVS